MKVQQLLWSVFLILVLTNCGSKNIKEQPQWQKYFQDAGIDSGAFELYDNTHDRVYVYNIPRNSTPYCPASTFKIFNSLVGLETNLIPDIDYVIQWDGVTRWNPDWNHDMDMQEAFKVSNVPYYQKVAEKIGRDTMQFYLDTVEYGNKKIGNELTTFWLDNSLQISPDEQLGFIKKLYFDKLPFSARSQRLVRSMMLQEENKQYKLYYKTGTAEQKDNYLCWLLGFFEKIEHETTVDTKIPVTHYRPYCFVLNFETKDKNVDFAKLKDIRINITKNIFKELELIK